MSRLPHGGLINRQEAITFSFNGRQYQGYQGDTLASALLANNLSFVGRSFKYGRPRGIVASGPEEPNAIMQVGAGSTSTPNIKATEVALSPGLIARTTNGWPSVNFDLMQVFDLLGGFLPPGFYYKTFMGPDGLWMFYEKIIRRMAGFGQAPDVPDLDKYDRQNQHADLVIAGGGPTGLAAALAAGRSGARVIIADERLHWGGMLLPSDPAIDGSAPLQWVDAVVAELKAMTNVTLLLNSTVFGNYENSFVTIVERRPGGGVAERVHRTRTKELLLATGAIERMPVFGNNDRPGVMLSRAISEYVQRYAVIPGEKLVLFTCQDYAYQTVRDWISSGREVAAIIDSRSEVSEKLTAPLEAQNVRILKGHVVTEVLGRNRVKAVRVASLKGGSLGLSSEDLSCDVLACSSGWSPAVHLACHSGDRPYWRDDIQGFVSGSGKTAGAAGGSYLLNTCLKEGYSAGLLAADISGQTATDIPAPICDPEVEGIQSSIFLVPHSKAVSRAPKQFVDFQNDVTAAAIELAAREGYQSVEHVKRYTALGFGTDQGKLSNVNGVAILAKTLNQSMDETGTTMFRPPYTPVGFGTIAGREVGSLLDPARLTAIHPWHLSKGAEWENVGQWKRPWFFPRAGESMSDAVQRECRAVRNSVGMLDASTLGKIDIRGRDAGEFLTRLYTNSYLKLKVGHCRYGVMLKEDGMIFDDGVIARIAEDHYIGTTTTGGAATVLQWMELWHQTEWPELDVYLTSVTDHWATIAVSGPDCRKVLEQLDFGISLADEDFPFMTWKDAQLDGVGVRIFRISFTGELSFEVNVPANHALAIWERIYDAGQPFGITPYGTETMHVLRAEKGFIIVGQDTDGSVTPADMGMNWIVNARKKFSFIGKRSLARSDTARANRKQWVGLLPDDPNRVLKEGSQLVFDAEQPIPMDMVGHVTSSYFSSTLNRSFALAMVKGGQDGSQGVCACR